MTVSHDNVCSSCGTQAQSGAQFCYRCGHAISPAVHVDHGDEAADACPSCGGLLKAGASFCHICGHDVSTAAETESADTVVATTQEPQAATEPDAAADASTHWGDETASTNATSPSSATRVSLSDTGDEETRADAVWPQSVSGSHESAEKHPPSEAVTRAAQRPQRPFVGGWGFAIFFFGLIGGFIGWLSLKDRDRPRADHVLKWGFIVTAISIAAWVLVWVAIFAAIAHHASSLSAAEVDTQQINTDTNVGATVPAPTRPIPDIGQSQTEETVTLSTTDGYSASATITVYKPFHADAFPALPYSGRTTLNSCTADPTTDAVVPVSFIITNTTASFNSTLGLRLGIQNDLFGGISSDAVFTNESLCGSEGSGNFYNITFNSPASPDTSDSADLFLVVPRYYTPNNPQGETAQLAQVKLYPQLITSGSGVADSTPDDPSLPLATLSTPVAPTLTESTKPTGAPSTVVDGTDFELTAPESWNVTASEEVHGDLSKDGYYETDLVAPNNENLLVRLDTSPGAGSLSPRSGAETGVGYLRHQPGYQLLAFRAATHGSLPAFRWEFKVREKGILLHKVDLFIQDQSGDFGMAILIQAPEADWKASKAVLNRIVNSVAVN